MKNLRKYGNSPFTVVVLHGGPGAPGEMEPVAENLSSLYGVLEPLQTADSVNGQVKELKETIVSSTDQQVVLMGWSWGAWLGYLFAARFPSLVKKLILVSSGPFEETYAENIMKTRMNRLSENDRAKVENILSKLQNKEYNNKALTEFGTLMEKADSYNLIPDTQRHELTFQPEIYEKVWNEASQLRRSGELIKLGKTITCPVVAIHGDYDPHPADGVKIPLSKVIKNFTFILLKKCGHTPWREKEAYKEFYTTLQNEL